MVVRGFVLAGGASTRFGTDKAFFPVEGVAMALRVGRALSPCCASVHVVGRDPRLETLLPWLEETPASFHPLHGVVTALAMLAPGETALIAPCDLPWLLPESARLLVAGAVPAVAAAEGRKQPLLVHLGRGSLDLAREILAREGGAWELVEEATAVDLPPEQLENLNRPPG